MNTFSFSVSMCVYKGDDAENFHQALESIYSQTLLPDEVVLVVDGPVCKEIDDVISEYEKSNALRVFRLPQNMGHGIARRTGFEKCKYDYIAIADADDINVSTRFEKQIEVFKRDSNIAAVSSDCYHFYGSVDNILNKEKFPVTDAEIKIAMKRRCPICQPSVMLSKKAVEQAGGYLDWYHAEDYYLWIRMLLNGCSFENVPEPLIYIRTTPEQMVRRGGIKYFSSIARLYIYMLKNGVIGLGDWLINTASRFVIQILMPAKLRSYIRQKFL